MAKLTKSSLKVLIKECLVEILAEGLAANADGLKNIAESRKTSSSLKESKNRSKTNRPALDYIHMNSENRSPPQETQEFIKNSDPIMEAIFNDTLKNTLANQTGAEGKDQYASRLAQGDAATKAMASADPTELFEGAGNWAALAFAEK